MVTFAGTQSGYQLATDFGRTAVKLIKIITYKFL